MEHNNKLKTLHEKIERRMRMEEELKLLNQLKSSLQNSMNIKTEEWKKLVYDYQE